ncbi:hypothetical protein D9F30_22740 [Escherichia coli]|nr:hypothetical protein [Escherichia coli]
MENQTIEKEIKHKKIITCCKYILYLLLTLMLSPFLYDLWDLLSTILMASETVEERQVVLAFGLRVSVYLLLFIMIFTVICRYDRKNVPTIL